MEKLEITKIHYHEFDELVRDTFPNQKDYECVAEYEWNNYQEHLVEYDESNFSEDDYEKFKKGETMYLSEYDVVAFLIHEGALEPGHYLIEVFW